LGQGDYLMALRLLKIHIVPIVVHTHTDTTLGVHRAWKMEGWVRCRHRETLVPPAFRNWQLGSKVVAQVGWTFMVCSDWIVLKVAQNYKSILLKRKR